jgi:cell division protein FtsA
MQKRGDKNLIVGLDIGTSKVVAIVGELNDDGEIEVVGIGSHPSRGLKKGVVVNIESTVHSIQRAVEEAELMAGCDIHSVYTGIAGSHVRSLNSHGIVAIRDKEVSPGDVDRVIDAAQAVAIPADQKILHILPQECRHVGRPTRGESAHGDGCGECGTEHRQVRPAMRAGSR